MQFDRLELLMKQQGKTKKHMGEIVGKGGYYIKDCKAKGIQVPESIVRAWADDLNTTYEYLVGIDEPPKVVINFGANSLNFAGIQNLQDKSTLNTDDVPFDGALHREKTNPFSTSDIAHRAAQNLKFNELYRQIAKKETAEADLQELERFMEYLVKRGE